MKLLRTSLMVTIAAVSTGCSQQNPGGPGADKSGSTTTIANRPVYGEAEGTFTLGVPILSTHLNQGENVSATITMNRGKNFDEDVTLKLSDLPQGVTADPAAPVVKQGEKEAKITLHAADDATPGDFAIKVTGHPAKGADATSTLKVSVAEKKDRK